MLKYILPLLLLFSVHVASAEDPTELVKLRATYDNSVRQAFQKVGKLYHDQLVQLKKNYMEAQNLEAAVAVDAEIKKLRETHGKMVVKVPEPQEKASSPLDGVWTVTTDKVYIKVFKGDKVLIENGVILNILKKGGVYYVNWDNGHWHKLTPRRGDPDVMDCLSKNGKKYTYKRFKW